MSDSDLLSFLNPQQREAVLQTEGPLLVIAGAGSGKTRVITHRIAYLISEKQVRPEEIFTATFTNRAAQEMKSRIMELSQHNEIYRLPIGTFHSHCAGILRHEATSVGLSPHFSICDTTDQNALLRDCTRELGFDPKYITPRVVAEAISRAKMALLDGEEAYKYILEARDESQAMIYQLYQKRLRESDAADFDDLLSLVVQLWSKNKNILEKYQTLYRYILVDEYQDTNLAQFELIRLLAGQRGNLCVVGDEDQSIYSWRGADISNLLQFKEHFPTAKLIKLEQNYRSSKNILAAAGALISRNSQRLGKTLWTESEEGDPLLEIEARTETEEARTMAEEIQRLRAESTDMEEIAIFYRVNALSRIYEEALREENIPYRVIGGLRFFDRAEIKDLLSYMQLLVNPGNRLALYRVINTPRRGIGKGALDKLSRFAQSRSQIMYEVLCSAELLGEAGLKGRAAGGAQLLAALIQKWSALVDELSLKELVETIIEDIEYKASLGDPKSMEVLSRLENINEFLGSLEQYEENHPRASLHDYLENIALRSEDSGAASREHSPGISLMTVHNAKGLEFDVVFIPALERGIFPNARAVQEQMHDEEERRLFYVALTRARKRIYISHADRRRLYGKNEWPAPSKFIREIPEELICPFEEAELAPLETKSPARGNTEVPQSSQIETMLKGVVGQHYHHRILGRVTVKAESEENGAKKWQVEDEEGKWHTLLVNYADMRPLAEDDAADRNKIRVNEEDDDLPF